MGQEARYRRKSDGGGDSMSKDSISEEARLGGSLIELDFVTRPQ